MITSLAASMTMAPSNFNTAIGLAGFCLSFLSFISADSADSSCPGPIQYYKDIGCTPVFSTPDSPCPERYNCDHLKSLPTDKCVINGHEYEVGESLRDEDRNPCDIGCRCVQHPGTSGPKFVCAIVDCPHRPPQPGCYFKRDALTCCHGPEACPENPEDRPICIVDGQKYKDGEHFKPASEPNKICYCGEGYNGENVKPFCYERKSKCGTMLRHSTDIRENCVPTYYHSQSPNTNCSVAYRCQNDRDTVIRRSTERSGVALTTPESSDSDMKCTFGNLTMNVGDELSRATDYSSVCVKCVCEVPPVPTCQRLSSQECNVRQHANFS